MSGRTLKWVGGALFVVAAIGMSIYFARVGLARANQSAGVIGTFIALAGLALSVHGVVRDRRKDQPSSTDGDPSGVRNTISGGGTFHGPVTQGRDFDQINLGPPAPPLSSRAAPPTDDSSDTGNG